jgi:8-oxo-dGTP diphosphatase
MKTPKKIKKPKTPVLTADGIILENNKILLVKRVPYPFSGFWSLPGGHVEYGEKVETAMKREIREELGITAQIKKLIGIYSDPKRDPRYHAVTAIYLLEKTKGKIKLDWESSEYRFFPLNRLPRKIGFDHRKIINDFKKNLKRSKMN